MVKTMQEIRQTKSCSWREVCRYSGLAYSSYQRWARRVRSGQTPLRTPGPKPMGQLDLAGLWTAIETLSHRRKRSHGVGALYDLYRGQISRRGLQLMVKRTRRERWQQKQDLMRRVEWKVPGLVWSMDELKIGPWRVCQFQDLASRYKFKPLVAETLPAEAVARHLEALYEEWGAPLVQKRDLGSNLCAAAVDQVLAKYWVIPLDSPPHYPPYNGSVERGNGEVKTNLQKIIAATRQEGEAHPQTCCELAASLCNHLERRSLTGRHACFTFATGKRAMRVYTKPRRKEICELIKQWAAENLGSTGNARRWQASAAWRWAVETWLQRVGAIDVSQNGKVLPLFHQIRSH